MDQQSSRSVDGYGLSTQGLVCIATGAKQHMGKIWWDSTLIAYLETRPLDQISWDEFNDVFYILYFSAIVKSQ